MKDSLMNFLVSPESGGPLRLVDEERQGAEVTEGSLICERTGTKYPIKKGVPRFAPEALSSNATAKRFGFQWAMQGQGKFEKATIYGKSADEEVDAFLQVTGLTVQDLSGLTIADVGCGSGRLSKRLAEYGATVLAFDISASTELVQHQAAGLPNLHVIQADLFRLPLPDRCLDVLWSEGVLHHTPAPSAAFSALAAKVADGGRMSIYVYSKVMSVYRRVRRWTPAVSRWPIGVLQVYCYAVAMLIYLLRIPAGKRQPYPLVHFMLFDTLACPYLSLHSQEEVKAWYETNGFDGVRITEPPVSAVGVKRAGVTSSSAAHDASSESVPLESPSMR